MTSRRAQSQHVGAALVGLGAAVALLTAGIPARAAEPDAEATLRRAAAVFAEVERGEIAKLSTALDTLVSDPTLIAPFRARDRNRLLELARTRFEALKTKQAITHFYFFDPEPKRTCFLRVHAPELHGDVDARDTLSQAIANHRIGLGLELGKTAFALRVVKPIRAGGQTLGYMELGEELGGFLGRVKERSGDDFALLVDKRRINRHELARVGHEDRWDERPDLVLVESTIWNERMIDVRVPMTRIPDGGVTLGRWTDGARTFLGGAFPVRDAAGQVVGVLVVSHAVTHS